MAKLSAHGAEIGRVEFLTSAKAYMADGKILKNSGFGWKLNATCKAGVAPEQAYANAIIRRDEFLSVRPSFEAYKKALHDMAGLSLRWKLHAAVQLMPDDPDGVWSEACDGYSGNVSASIDEVSRLCTLYGASLIEQAELKDPTNCLA